MLCDTLKLYLFVTLVIKLWQAITGLHLNKYTAVLAYTPKYREKKPTSKVTRSFSGSTISLCCEDLHSSFAFIMI